MAEIDESKAYSILGLAPGANSAQVNIAHAKLVAFFTDDETATGALKQLTERLRADIEVAHKLLSKSTSAGAGSSTISSTTNKKAASAPGGKNNSLIWLVAVLLLGVVCFQMNSQVPVKRPDSRDVYNPTPSPGPGPNISNPDAPERPPEFIVPFIHSDDAAGTPTRWTSGWQNVDGAQRMIVWAYAANGDPVYKFEMYQDGSKWREWKHYIVRYSADRLTVAVQRFQEAGSIPVFKDQRNVSNTGDVLAQTTTYNFLPSTKLDSVRVDTPFIKNHDGLQINRDGGSLEVERTPGGGSINLEANSRLLNNQFNLWSVFGEPNI